MVDNICNCEEKIISKLNLKSNVFVPKGKYIFKFSNNINIDYNKKIENNEKIIYRNKNYNNNNSNNYKNEYQKKNTIY